MSHNCITLTQEDLINWAEFSHDNNPIHFDLEAAKKVNLDSIVAHGKLALLSVKSGVNEHLVPNNKECYHFKAMFRSPVRCNTPVTLQLEDKKGIKRFNLIEVANKQSCIKGRISEATMPNIEQVMTNGSVTTTELEHNIALFVKHFPNSLADWIVLENIIFSQLVESHLDEVLSTCDSAKTISIKHSAGSNDNNMNFVMQTNQETFFSPKLVKNTLAAHQTKDIALRYQIANPIYFESSKSDICSIDIAVLINDEMCMLTRYGFILI